MQPVKTHENDRLDYPAAIAEIERIVGKEVTSVSGYFKHIKNKEIRWLFNFEMGFCYINDKCQLYEMQPGPQSFQYRGKVHEEVFYSADERKNLLEQLSKRRIGVQHQIASLVHTEKFNLQETLNMTDEEIEVAYNDMRMELDS